MPRIQKSYRSPAKLTCPVEGCRKECWTYSGLTQHLYAKHKEHQPGTPLSPSTAAVNDCIILDSDLSSDSDPAGAWGAFSSESNHDGIGFDFEMPLPSLLPSLPDTPSQESEALGSNVDYHPIINAHR